MQRRVSFCLPPDTKEAEAAKSEGRPAQATSPQECSKRRRGRPRKATQHPVPTKAKYIRLFKEVSVGDLLKILAYMDKDLKLKVDLVSQ